MTHLDPQPPPKPGHGDVWIDVMRDLTSRAPWRRWMWWLPKDSRSDDAVLRVGLFARIGTVWVSTPWPHLQAYWDGVRPLLADMYKRREQGLSRYGVPLQYDNWRDHWTDAYQEVLDLVAYLHAARAPWWMRWGAILFAAVLRKRVRS